ncbi:GAF and ANTAR domain-containing protein [Humibacillus xanthopallidus]|uniref:GAF domain-containing protein n=1 Tax=Humibacillus xanthopallidus TaxID=412689 RepID=A0A543HHZ5_9MICO|nr:GAF and ANTAR domain-containing protein [Humibacillus xanthopallidus]TQM57953.1 GAF domain-containing protein [Humibacillus xanthopallidus]
MAIAADDTSTGAQAPRPAASSASGAGVPPARLEDVIDEPLTELTRRLVETEGVTGTLADILDSAVVAVPCGWAAAAVMDEVRDRPARLSAATDASLAVLTAQIAAAAGASPGILAFRSGEVVHCPDLSCEARFADYSAEMLAHTEVLSVLSLPLHLRGETLGVLTLYAATPGAFDEGAIQRATELADLAAVAVDASLAAERADHLSRALGNSRDIGLAIGVLVERYKMTPEQAFRELSEASQNSNRKLVELARDLAETGEFAPRLHP